jgi:hypothetical protein
MMKPIVLLYLLKLNDGTILGQWKVLQLNIPRVSNEGFVNYQFSNTQLDEAKATEGKNILCETQDTVNRKLSA